MATPKVVDFFDTNAAASNLNVPVRKFRSWANGQLNKAEKEAGLSLVGFPKPLGRSGKHHWSNRALSNWAKLNNNALVKLGYHAKVAEKKQVQTITTAELTREYGISGTRLNTLAKAKGKLSKTVIDAGLSMVGFPEPIKVGAANLWPKAASRKWFKANAEALAKLGYTAPNSGKATKVTNAAKAIKPKALKQPVEKSSKKVEDIDLLKDLDRELPARGNKRVKSTIIAELKLNDKYTLAPLGSEVKSISLDLGETGTVQSGARALATLLSAVSIGVSIRSVKVAKAAKADEGLLHAWLADVAAVAGVHNSVLVEWEGSIGKAVIHRKLEIAKK
ncbi:hypothetical protein TOTORO_00770 [Serratia phage vB_SmaS-Totoro]|nr:hypothetical protein TOTORO_00770 [Serratia phage vB_SmaS-Totoro]